MRQIGSKFYNAGKHRLLKGEKLIGSWAQLCSPMSVSYTHLDVYKRQVSLSWAMVSFKAVSCSLVPAKAVSYTHLDVYKRQGDPGRFQISLQYMALR